MSAMKPMTGFPFPQDATQTVARNAALNLEFLFLQNLCDELGGLRFLESQLGKAENRIDHHLGEVFAGIDTSYSFGFQGVQRWNLS